MQVKLGEKIVEAWQVKQGEEPLEDWVQNLFDKQICFWNPKNPAQLRFNMIFGGAAYDGDYLIYLGEK